MARVLCGQCGHANPRTARFCGGCGQSSPTIGTNQPPLVAAAGGRHATSSEVDKHTLPEQAVAALQTLPPGTALLMVAGGEEVSSGFRLEGDVVSVGRHPGSDVFLDDSSVSRHHAEFRRYGDTYAIRDLGGFNGTYVNHERVEETVLSSRDEMRLGKFHLVFLTA